MGPENWAVLVRHASAFLAVVLGVETGVDGQQIFVADLLQQQLAPGEPQGAHVNPHAPMISRHADRQTDRRWEMTPCPLKQVR